MILIDAVVLIFLLQAFNDEEVEFVSALVISLATSIVTGILSVVLAIYLGLAGIVLTGVICALALGAALSALFGIGLKQAFVIGTLFMLIHIGISIGIQLAFSAA